MEVTAPVVTPSPAVNGPEDNLLDWHGIDWATCEENVRRLRQRIFKATQDGDLKKVRYLQRLMLRSRSNTLVSVKRVTQQSSGRETAGIDGERALTPKARGTLAAEIHRSSNPVCSRCRPSGTFRWRPWPPRSGMDYLFVECNNGCRAAAAAGR
ncbi:reverse transcriptase N-terminal domain-containing protein [Streptomyces sp. NPDC056910]|uniref:reverse transcriptase N-terminal domain-containing protein n=1 Tax=Streptomyces sp. NPDC056910 TaxID=3345964 RepID=UPI00367FE1FA